MKEVTVQHLKKAFLNERFFFKHEKDWFIEDDEDLGWAAIVLFYAAVHYVDALMEELGEYPKPTFHRDKPSKDGKAGEKGRTSRAKEELVASNGKSKNILGGQQYKQLYDMSMTARYDPVMSNYFSRHNLEAAKKIIGLIRTITVIRLGYEPVTDPKFVANVSVRACNRRKLKEELMSYM